jgi:hypothetical protein
MTGTSEQGNHKRRFQADQGNQGNQGNQVDPCGRPWEPGRPQGSTLLYTFLHDREAAVEAASRSWWCDGGNLLWPPARPYKGRERQCA